MKVFKLNILLVMMTQDKLPPISPLPQAFCIAELIDFTHIIQGRQLEMKSGLQTKLWIIPSKMIKGSNQIDYLITMTNETQLSLTDLILG